jgi:mycothiol synthase
VVSDRNRIRLCEPGDNPALAAVQTACDPEHPQTAADFAHADTLEDDRIHRARYLWEEAGEVLAYAGYFQFSMMYDPDRFALYGGVRPAARRRGIGTALLDRLLADLLPRRPRTIGFAQWEYLGEGMEFLLGRGYPEIMRDIESRVDLERFDAEAFAESTHRVEAAGLRIVPMTELEDGEALRRRICDLDMAVSEDMPMTGELTPPRFDIYAHLHFASPHFRPELCWLVLDGEELVGLCWHVAGAREDELETCVSGVLRSHRRRGIAMAVKARALADARERGYRTIRTRNEKNNIGMLTVNHRLGYRPCGSMIILEKELAS